MSLRVYEKPLSYAIIHVILGVIAAFYTPVALLFLIYQLSQLALDRRFFLFEWEIKTGNSLDHTVVKLLEFSLGFLVGKFLHYATTLHKQKYL
jgi:hypothetical protein